MDNQRRNYFPARRPRITASPPSNKVNPLIAEAGSISGAEATTLALATPQTDISSNATPRILFTIPPLYLPRIANSRGSPVRSRTAAPGQCEASKPCLPDSKGRANLKKLIS